MGPGGGTNSSCDEPNRGEFDLELLFEEALLMPRRLLTTEERFCAEVLPILVGTILPGFEITTIRRFARRSNPVLGKLGGLGDARFKSRYKSLTSLSAVILKIRRMGNVYIFCSLP
eukprot:3493901-Pleurochrysis_carterae.AAC.2